jgi:hypothetical protein
MPPQQNSQFFPAALLSGHCQPASSLDEMQWNPGQGVA